MILGSNEEYIPKIIALINRLAKKNRLEREAAEKAAKLAKEKK